MNDFRRRAGRTPPAHLFLKVPMISGKTIKRGISNGLMTTWELTKIMVPVYLVVTILKYTGVLAWIARVFAPAMHLLGLPGEAALAMVLGIFLSLYAGIGAMAMLALTAKQITILAGMLLLCHNMLVETAVTKKTGVIAWRFVALRVILALVFGICFNLVL